MTVVSFIEAWWLSVRPIMEAAGVTGSFQRSPPDRLKPSCSLNLRRGEHERDLIVWESGEAELAVSAVPVAEQIHIADIRSAQPLAAALSRLTELASIA